MPSPIVQSTSDPIDETALDNVAGELLRSAREQSGLTEAELATRSGVSQELISAYESGDSQPTFPALLRLVSTTGYELRVRLEKTVPDPEEAAHWTARPYLIERRRWDRSEGEGPPGGIERRAHPSISESYDPSTDERPSSSAWPEPPRLVAGGSEPGDP
jgi:transcriptional regulator with XRE-family HTH domain